MGKQKKRRDGQKGEAGVAAVAAGALRGAVIKGLTSPEMERERETNWLSVKGKE